MLVFALNLKEVEEVCACCADLDEVLVGRGLWCWLCCGMKFLWSLHIVCQFDGAHVGGGTGKVSSGKREALLSLNRNGSSLRMCQGYKQCETRSAQVDDSMQVKSKDRLS